MDMDNIYEAIRELNKPLEESNSAEDFIKKSKTRQFATLSAFVDASLFTDIKTQTYDEIGHQKYNERATFKLEQELQSLGLDYQKVTGIWDGGKEKSFIVFNTSYIYDYFEALMLKLAKNYIQWGVCIGKFENTEYCIKSFLTDSLTDINYFVKEIFTEIKIADVLSKYLTITTRHVYDENGQLDLENKPAFTFEEYQKSISAISSDSLIGARLKDEKLKEYLDKDIYDSIEQKLKQERVEKRFKKSV